MHLLLIYRYIKDTCRIHAFIHIFTELHQGDSLISPMVSFLILSKVNSCDQDVWTTYGDMTSGTKSDCVQKTAANVRLKQLCKRITIHWALPFLSREKSPSSVRQSNIPLSFLRGSQIDVQNISTFVKVTCLFDNMLCSKGRGSHQMVGCSQPQLVGGITALGRGFPAMVAYVGWKYERLCWKDFCRRIDVFRRNS